MPAATAAPASPKQSVRVSVASSLGVPAPPAVEHQDPEAVTQERAIRSARGDRLRCPDRITGEAGDLVTAIVVQHQQSPVRAQYTASLGQLVIPVRRTGLEPGPGSDQHIRAAVRIEPGASADEAGIARIRPPTPSSWGRQMGIRRAHDDDLAVIDRSERIQRRGDAGLGVHGAQQPRSKIGIVQPDR